MKENRLAYIDSLRGWAIMGVVTIHLSSLLLPKASLPSTYFRWAVPIFLIISSWLSMRSLNRSQEPYCTFIKRRWTKILTPFLFYSAFYMVLTLDTSHISPIQIITKHWLGHGWSGQYFFIVLLQLLPLYPILMKRRIPLSFLAVVFLISLLLLPLAQIAMSHVSLIGKLGDNPFVYWLPYIVFGAFIAQHEEGWQRWISRISPLLGLSCLLLLPLIITIFPAAPLQKSAYQVPSVCFVSFAIFPFACAAFQKVNVPVLPILGRYSLSVFCLHPLILLLLGNTRIEDSFIHLPSPVQTSVFIAILLLVVVGCLGIGQCWEKLGLKSLAV